MMLRRKAEPPEASCAYATMLAGGNYRPPDTWLEKGGQQLEWYMVLIRHHIYTIIYNYVHIYISIHHVVFFCVSYLMQLAAMG
jgi:hypothetical protein